MTGEPCYKPGIGTLILELVYGYVIADVNVASVKQVSIRFVSGKSLCNRGERRKIFDPVD